MSLSQYSLKLISEECRSLLVRGRLDQIRQLGRNQIGFQFYTDSGRRDLVLDICPTHNWLYLATTRPKSQDPDARVMFLRKYLNKQPLVAWEQFSEDRLIRLHWGNGHVLVLELSGRHANLFLLDAEQSIMLSWVQSHSQRLLRSGKIYQPPTSMAFREQRDPYLLAAYPADGTRSLHLQQAHLFYQSFESLRLRVQRLKKELTR